MGILKISDALHDEIRQSSAAMSRSINAQAEFWIKIGRLSEMNPSLTYQQIIQQFVLNKAALNVTVLEEQLQS